jgi:hypothetical protein
MLDRTTELKTYQTYIDGSWTDAASGKTFQTFDPRTWEDHAPDRTAYRATCRAPRSN